MLSQPTITFRGMASSPSVESAIERWVTRLETASNEIQRCAVVVVPHGKSIQIHLEIIVPDRTIAVTRDPAAREDLYVTVADAFRAAFHELRQLRLCAA